MHCVDTSTTGRSDSRGPVALSTGFHRVLSRRRAARRLARRGRQVERLGPGPFRLPVRVRTEVGQTLGEQALPREGVIAPERNEPFRKINYLSLLRNSR